MRDPALKSTSSRSRARGSREDSAPLPMHARAEADLAFVRATVERSAYFSAVPGVAGMLMGATALVAAAVAEAQPTRDAWLTVWLVEAVVAGTIGSIGIVQKARRRQVSLGTGAARRFALGMLPPIVAGGALTFACVRADAWSLIAPVWLLCYGIAVLGAGAVSATRVVPAMGALFLFCGIAAVASPATWNHWYMACAFGVGHIVAGAIIARRHGG
ncbi:MAG: hypothetical protein V4617_19790 [Gemmatimonadota bacterium]